MNGRLILITITLIIISASMIMVNRLFAQTRGIPPDTVLAEYRDGVFTKACFTEEFGRLPYMFRARYGSYEGRRLFLEAVVLNRIAYLESLELGIDGDPETFEEFKKHLKPYYAGIYRKKEITEQVELTPEELESGRDHFIRRTRERQLKSQTVNELQEKYNIHIDYDLLYSLNLFNLTPFCQILQEKVVSSDLPELEVYVSELFVHFQRLTPFITTDDITAGFEYFSHVRHLPREEWQELSSPETLERLINNVLEVNLFEREARLLGYDEMVIDDIDWGQISKEPEGSLYDSAVFQNPEVQQLRRYIILRAFFQKEVADVVDPTPEDIYRFYQANIDNFTSEATRRLQFFPFDTEEEARKAREIVRKGVAENDEWLIIEQIRKNKHSRLIRAFELVEQHADLPILGNDQAIKDVIWNTGVGELSDIHRSDGGLFFFLAVVEHNPHFVYPLERFESDISALLTHNRRAVRWQIVKESLLDEYEVVFYPDRLSIVLSANELFNLAEQAQSRRRLTEAIYYYDQIINNYKNNNDDYRALFSKAFIYGISIGETEKAKYLFRQLVEDYPRGELHDAAEYMLQIFTEGTENR